VYASNIDVQAVRQVVSRRLHSDPVSVLEEALVLLELHECNQTENRTLIPGDMPFIATCFNSKRCNGWIAIMGDTDGPQLQQAINSRWQFQFFPGRTRRTGVYLLLNMLARYGFVYGRIAAGDAHGLGHFIEDHAPGLLICRGRMDDLELTLSLAAMKLGVPAIVPQDYPFPVGRHVRAQTLDQIADAVVAFPNVRRLLHTPELFPFPAYCKEENRKQKIVPALTWGNTPLSFYIVRKGPVLCPGVDVIGQPTGSIGIVVTIEGHPLDAMDRHYIERAIITSLTMIDGVTVKYDGQSIAIPIAAGVNLDPRAIGDVLVAAVRHQFPKLNKVSVQVIFDTDRLNADAERVRLEKESRELEISQMTEESVDQFCTCVGCSPFAPDHVCILTPQRPPQCGRGLAWIKAGALYNYDDMSNIHHSQLHRQMNSFGLTDKGRLIDEKAGEWEGVNAAVARLSHGRTKRVTLHALGDAPPTGCGCFRLIMFKTDKPRPGIAIMERGYVGRVPDGRSWRDLHYALAGKQTPGIAGADFPYLLSQKFLAGEGGWSAVVWVSPKIAAIMADKLPSTIEIGPQPPA
jgi:hypothetical protein